MMVAHVAAVSGHLPHLDVDLDLHLARPLDALLHMLVVCEPFLDAATILSVAALVAVVLLVLWGVAEVFGRPRRVRPDPKQG